MARPDKVAVVDRVAEQLSGAAATLLTDYRGLSVEELAELRAELRKVDATYEVVKNTLTRIAARNAGMEGLDEMLVGPTALVFCGEDPVGPAKALKAFGKDHEALVIKGGYLEGSAIDAEATIKLADLESREDLLARLAGMMNNALAGFARLLQAPISDMARLMGALEADGGVEAKGFSPTGAAAPAEDAEATDADAAADRDEPEDEEAPAVAEAEAAADVVEDASDDSDDSSDDSDDSSDDSDESEDSADEDASDEDDAEDEDEDASPAEAVAASVSDAAASAAETAGAVAEGAASAVASAAETVAEAVDGVVGDDDTDDADAEADDADADTEEVASDEEE